MERDRIKFDNLLIHGAVPYESARDALEVLEDLSELDQPPFLKNVTVELDAEEIDECAVSFSGNEDEEFLIFHITESGNLQFDSQVQGDHIEKINELLPTIIGYFEQNLDLHTLHLYADIDAEFSELDLPIDKRSKFDIRGIRINEEDYSYIIQSDDGGSTCFCELDCEGIEINETNGDDLIDESAENCISFLSQF